jgi:predicted metal-dependent HD superfamily phosphohydrolase
MDTQQIRLILRYGRYAEPWRHYHTWEHVKLMFDEYWEVRHLVSAADRQQIALAIMFHDAVYEPTAHNNEERSAQLAEGILAPTMSLADVCEVVRLILLTKHYQPQDGDLNGQIICDCDLSVLGWPWGNFEEFGRQIREEYIFVDDQTFRTHRRQFMRTYLARPRIFNLEYFQQKYEAQARQNLQRTIALLS